MDVLLQDIRFALRSLRRTPGFAAVVIAVMTLGIGVNTMIFSMVYGVMLRPWPLPDPERIVAVGQMDPKHHDEDRGMSFQNYLDLREQSRSFSHFGGLWDMNAYVTLDRDPERLWAANITSELFPALGVMPVLGRNFTREEEVWGRNWTQVIISDRIWRDRYGASPGALGRTLKLNGRIRTIVGVMPPGFRYPEIQDFWIPAGHDATEDKRQDGTLVGVARLKPGVTVKQADAEIKTLMAGLVKQYPKENENQSAHVHGLQEWYSRGPRPLMYLMLAAVGFLLLISCANVANLMLARAAGRRREISLRMALGASRPRVVRQLLTESVLLAAVSALLGVALAHWANGIWINAIPMEKPFFMDFSIDAPVLLYTVVIATVAGIMFGLAPAMHATDTHLSEALREGSSQAGSSRAGNLMRNGLVVAEIAFSLVLLIGSGLMVRSFMHLERAGRGLRTDHVVSAQTLLPIATYPDENSRRVFMRELDARLAALPGMRGHAIVTRLPLNRGNRTNGIIADGAKYVSPQDAPQSNIIRGLPGYFELIGLPLKRGRDFTEADREGRERVAIVNEALAKKLWPGQDPIGRRVRLSFEADSLATAWRTVIGVAPDIAQNAEGDDVPATVYLSQMQEPDQTFIVLVRSERPLAQVTAELRQTLRSIAPDLALTEVRTLEAQFRFQMWMRRLFASLMAVFGVMALVIAAVGLYGVMAYSVAQRTQEIGIRMALGAAREQVVRMVVGQALRLTLLGCAIGIAAALLVTQAMATLLYGVKPTDPPTYAIVAIALVMSGLFAAAVPALRATRVDPMIALRAG
ncbi:MAG: ABC transporter permease [Candidatus Eisenbacteria bacterium]